VSEKLTFAVELLRVGLSLPEIGVALGWSVRETERQLRDSPLQLPQRVMVTQPAGCDLYLISAFAGPFMRLLRVEKRELADHVAREWERGVYPPHLIGELRRCLQPTRKEAPCAVPA
jgi:hypothetical protein